MVPQHPGKALIFGVGLGGSVKGTLFRPPLGPVKMEFLAMKTERDAH